MIALVWTSAISIDNVYLVWWVRSEKSLLCEIEMFYVILASKIYKTFSKYFFNQVKQV